MELVLTRDGYWIQASLGGEGEPRHNYGRGGPAGPPSHQQSGFSRGGGGGGRGRGRGYGNQGFAPPYNQQGQQGYPNQQGYGNPRPQVRIKQAPGSLSPVLETCLLCLYSCSVLSPSEEVQHLKYHHQYCRSFVFPCY